MNLGSTSHGFVLALASIGLIAMLATAGLHMYTVFTLPDAAHVTPDMIPAPSAQRDKSPAPETALSDEQMAEVSELMAKLKQNPNDGATLAALGDTFLKASDWARAEFFLSKAVLSKPSDIRPRYMLGIAQYQQNKIGQTIKTFEELLEIGEDLSTMYNLAVIYKYQANDPKRAATLFQRIINLPGTEPEVAAKARDELK